MLQVGAGVLADGRTPRWSDLREMAQVAEGIGFDVLFVPDHLHFRESPPDNTAPVEMPAGKTRGIWEAWTVLAALAEATRRIELGPFIACNSFRNPALLAKMAVTLDEVSAGRLVLGIGAGWHEPEYRAFGFPYDQRVGRLEEALQITPPPAPKRACGLPGTFLLGPRLRDGATRAAPGGTADSDRSPEAPDDAPRGNVRGHLRRRLPPRPGHGGGVLRSPRRDLPLGRSEPAKRSSEARRGGGSGTRCQGHACRCERDRPIRTGGHDPGNSRRKRGRADRVRQRLRGDRHGSPYPQSESTPRGQAASNNWRRWSKACAEALSRSPARADNEISDAGGAASPHPGRAAQGGAAGAGVLKITLSFG